MLNQKKLIALKNALKLRQTPELVAFFEKRDDLQLQLRSNRRSIENLLDFALGFKSLPKKQAWVRTKEDEWRLLSTIKNLHAQNHSLKKELLKELLHAIVE
ncbi:MAG: hypothetical protein SFW07_06720 [Gammaproteobacteria bacterium]|nr:hypothetical protein [Gammaproteobacteria bacterium]